MNTQSKSMKIITSLDHLKEEAAYKTGEYTEFCILLAGGLARSSKRILYFPDSKTFDIINEIDDSEQEGLNEEQLKTETHITEAIEKGAFYKL
jgi:hypothetical protein